MTEPNSIVEALLEPAPDTPAQQPEKATAEPDSPQPEVAATPDTPAPEPEAKAETLKEYAERNGVKLDDLYGLKTSSGHSLSELSDKAKDLDKLDVRTTEQARAEAEFRAEQAKFNEYVADWTALVQQGQNTPEALERLQAQKAEHLKAQELQTLQVIPEWADNTAKTADQQRINAFATRFGGPPDTAEQLTAPWANLMMRYVLTLEDQFQSALAKVEKVKNKPLPSPGKSTRPAVPPDGLNAQAQALLKGLQNG